MIQPCMADSPRRRTPGASGSLRVPRGGVGESVAGLLVRVDPEPRDAAEVGDIPSQDSGNPMDEGDGCDEDIEGSDPLSAGTKERGQGRRTDGRRAYQRQNLDLGETPLDPLDLPLDEMPIPVRADVQFVDVHLARRDAGFRRGLHGPSRLRSVSHRIDEDGCVEARHRGRFFFHPSSSARGRSTLKAAVRKRWNSSSGTSARTPKSSVSFGFRAASRRITSLKLSPSRFSFWSDSYTSSARATFFAIWFCVCIFICISFSFSISRRTDRIARIVGSMWAQ